MAKAGDGMAKAGDGMPKSKGVNSKSVEIVSGNEYSFC